jgi:hypothetical protein
MNGYVFPRPLIILYSHKITLITEQIFIVILTESKLYCQEEKTSPDLPIFCYNEKKTYNPYDRNQEHQIASIEGMLFCKIIDYLTGFQRLFLLIFSYLF